ncbi:23S rRNA m(2)A2503 methyltransferase/tRNA m(2)A37 methyltransferase [Gammaproteobacteria bacterium]
MDTRMETGQMNLLGMDRQTLKTLFAGWGYKPFHGEQVFKWIHKQGLTDFDQMTDLGKRLRAALSERAEVHWPRVVVEQTSRDGTHKWVFELDCGNRIETVLIPDGDRTTLCVSSQAGCALACAFCSTARQGFNRNLTVAEIIGQVRVAQQWLAPRPLTNVVLMGMGEPLANFEAVVTATAMMQDDLAYGLSKYRVTVSTAGLVPAIRRLKAVSDVSLAVSLHAPEDRLRDLLVPINRKYPIEALLAACVDFIGGDARRKVTFEYVMLDGINDSEAQAKALARLLTGVPAKVNLIPFNPFPGTDFSSSPLDRIERFQALLVRAGLRTLMRRTRGGDIDAACGQLVGRVFDRSRRHPVVPAISAMPPEYPGRMA